jgi:hypothetical protein
MYAGSYRATREGEIRNTGELLPVLFCTVSDHCGTNWLRHLHRASPNAAFDMATFAGPRPRCAVQRSAGGNGAGSYPMEYSVITVLQASNLAELLMTAETGRSISVPDYAMKARQGDFAR